MIRYGAFQLARTASQGRAKSASATTDRLRILVELVGIEPTTSSLRIMSAEAAGDSTKKHN